MVNETTTKLTRRIFILLILSLIIYSPVQSPAQTAPSSVMTDLTGVNVAIYSGNGVLSHSYRALTMMFEWMNATIVLVSASRIINDYLDDCDIVVFPGGPAATYSSDLGDEGKEKIKDFVTNGGSYFGICGGSIFGASSLRFFNGTIRGVYEPGAAQHLTTMHINQSSAGPDLSDSPESVLTMYWASSYFSPRDGFEMTPIALYDYNNEAGMIAFQHKLGSVFLSSPHPEYEEGSDRDDTAFGDDLDDPDSEWDILLRVSKWLVDTSIVEPTPSEQTTPTESTTTDLSTPSDSSNPASSLALDLPMASIALIGSVVVVLTITLLYRRKGI